MDLWPLYLYRISIRRYQMANFTHLHGRAIGPQILTEQLALRYKIEELEWPVWLLQVPLLILYSAIADCTIRVTFFI
jgi:hypothetical protein